MFDKKDMLQQINNYFKKTSSRQLIKDIVETNSDCCFENKEDLLLESDKL